MPDNEGLALYEAALSAPVTASLTWVEIGAYCGKSTIYLGAAASSRGALLFSIDHHRGSEENQPGSLYHDPSLVDPETGLMDTVPTWRRSITTAKLEEYVVGVIGESSAVAAHWRTPIGFLFIDGGHGEKVAWKDYKSWTPHLAPGGILAIHDVFTDPAEGGQVPYDIWVFATTNDNFSEVSACGSLRVLQNTRISGCTERASHPPTRNRPHNGNNMHLPHRKGQDH